MRYFPKRELIPGKLPEDPRNPDFETSGGKYFNYDLSLKNFINQIIMKKKNLRKFGIGFVIFGGLSAGFSSAALLSESSLPAIGNIITGALVIVLGIIIIRGNNTDDEA